ncbi:MAG: Ldh family oxidoreductase [Haloferacaceae archaeon]
MPPVEPKALESLVAAIVEDFGAASGDATAVARSLVDADLCGHHSHGVRLLAAKYVPEIQDGKIEPAAEPALVRDSPTTAIVDGRDAFGQVTGRFAIDRAIEAATQSGLCVLGVRNGTHLGRVGEWAERAAAADLACLAFVTNPGSRHVAPAGTAWPRLSTNPIAIGIPTFDAVDFPILLDVATSQLAKGKTRLYAAQEKDLPEGVVRTSTGDAVTDPAEYLDGRGALQPLGGTVAGHKGFGLAVVGELLAGIVSDGDVSGEADAAWGNEAAFFLVDPTRFSTRERIEERIVAFEAYLESTPSAEFGPGFAAHGDRPLLPGAAEHRQRRQSRREGISLPEADAAALVELATERGLEDVVPPALTGGR